MTVTANMQLIIFNMNQEHQKDNESGGGGGAIAYPDSQKFQTLLYHVCEQ